MAELRPTTAEAAAASSDLDISKRVPELWCARFRLTLTSENCHGKDGEGVHGRELGKAEKRRRQ